MYTIFLCVFYTGWASLFLLFFSFWVASFWSQGGGFRIYFRLAFLCFSEDISGYRIGGGGVQSVKFYNIWEGVLLSENLGWGEGTRKGAEVSKEWILLC